MNQEALANAEKLIEIQPENADNRIMKGQILQGLDWHHDDSVAFDIALKLNPSRTDVLGMKASSPGKIGQSDEALTLINKGIELAPNVTETFYNRACICRLKGG